jgi:hypothetical protein
MREDIGLETLIQDELGAYGAFGDKLYLIHVGDGKYAVNNISLPDGQQIDGLAAFMSLDDAYTYMGLDMARGISGDVVQKSFSEAREIAISKPQLMALIMFSGGQIIDIHYVR